MSHCDVCNKEGDFSFSIQVHSFPRDAEIRKQWIHAVQGVIEGWTPNEDSVLCSKHFEESCYKDPDPVLGKAGKMCRGLKDTAVPTIFKTSVKADLVRNHRENGKLSSPEMDRHLAKDGQDNTSNRDKGATTNNKGKDELQSKLPSNSHHLSNGETNTDAVTLSADGISVTFDEEGSHEEQRESEEWTPASKQESNPVIFFYGDLNLPLRKVFEQMAKIKEEQRVRRAAIDQSRRDREDRRWHTVAQDFRTNLETYTQRFETSKSHIPVTLDPSAPRTLSVLGDSQETFRLKEEVTVPCLGKLYCRSRSRALCPHCGVILGNMRKVVIHMCNAKRKALESGRHGIIPDIALISEKKWKRFPQFARKTTRSTGGLVDVCRLIGEPSTHNANNTKTKIKKRKRKVNMWKKLKLKQTSKISRKISPVTKKKKKKKKKKKMKKKKEKDKVEFKGQIETVKMQVQAKSELKSCIEQSLDERIQEMREMERTSILSELTNEDAADLFADLESRGFVRTIKEPGDLGYPLQSDMGQSQEQSMANTANLPQVYPVSIIPSSLLLTNLNTAPCPENNDSMDLDDKSLLRAQLGLLPEADFPSPVQYENSSAVEFPRLDTQCSNGQELGRHQRQDTVPALNFCGVGGGGGDSGGGGGGIRLSDGTFVKAEPVDYDR